MSRSPTAPTPSSAAPPTREQVLASLAALRPELEGFARRSVGPAAAEEIVQASFARAVERIDQLAASDSARAWLYRIVRNAIVDHRRRARAERRATDAFEVEPRPPVEAVTRAPRACQCVLRVMESLKPEQHTALRRIEIDASSVKGFASEQGIQANAAAVRVFRAREALKKKLVSTCGTCAEGGGCFDCTCGP